MFLTAGTLYTNPTATIYIIIIIIAAAITANHLAIFHLVTLVLAEGAGTYPFSGRVSLRRDDSLNATQIHMFTIHLLHRQNNLYSIIIIHPICSRTRERRDSYCVTQLATSVSSGRNFR